jgi:hypothetical protein
VLTTAQAREKFQLPERTSVLAIMNLGATVEIIYTPAAMASTLKADPRPRAAGNKEALRVTLIHGDVFTLSVASFEVRDPKHSVNADILIRTIRRVR